jgi:hypothetical protein
MYEFNFKDKIPPKASKWYLVKIVVYALILFLLIYLVIDKLNSIT